MDRGQSEGPGSFRLNPAAFRPNVQLRASVTSVNARPVWEAQTPKPPNPQPPPPKSVSEGRGRPPCLKRAPGAPNIRAITAGTPHSPRTEVWVMDTRWVMDVPPGTAYHSHPSQHYQPNNKSVLKTHLFALAFPKA